MIADGTAARIVEHRGPGSGFTELAGKTWRAPAATEFKDRQGRTFSSVGSARHKKEPRNRATTDQDLLAADLVADLS